MSNNIEKDILYDYHNYGCHIGSREIFLHNHYGSNDEENPGVEYKMSNTFIKNLRSLDAKSSDNVIIHLHSVGGELSDGMAIFDAITMSRCFITMLAYGQVESMSSIIFQSADARYITPNTYFMSHFGSAAAGGGYLDVQNWMKYEKIICDVMLDVYAKNCANGTYFVDRYGKGAFTKVKNYLNTKLKSGDWYISAEEAVHYGFADKVVKSWEEIK